MRHPDAAQRITRLLRAHHDDDREAFDQLVPLVYERLRRIARGQLARGCSKSWADQKVDIGRA